MVLNLRIGISKFNNKFLKKVANREIILGKKNFKNFNNNMNVVKTYNIYIDVYYKSVWMACD